MELLLFGKTNPFSLAFCTGITDDSIFSFSVDDDANMTSGSQAFCPCPCPPLGQKLFGTAAANDHDDGNRARILHFVGDRLLSRKMCTILLPFHVLGIDWTDRCNASLIRVSGYYYEVPTLKYAQKL